MATAPISADDDLSCPICFELFMDPSTPKNLPCGHVICDVCLKQIVAGKCQRTCPECRKIIRIPSGGSVCFSTNFRLRSLAEKHQNVGDSQKSHAKKRVPLCPDHYDEKMHYYCVDCNSLACQVCLTLTHNGLGHTIKGIKETCDRQKVEIQYAIGRAESSIEEREKLLSECKVAEIHNCERHDTVEKQVNEYIEIRVNEILEEGQALKEQLASSKQFHDSRLKQQTSSVEKTITSFKNSYQAVLSATENLSDCEYITQHTHLINKMNEIEISKPANKNKQEVIKFVPSSSHAKLGHIIAILPEKARTVKRIQTLDEFDYAYRVDCTPDGLLSAFDSLKKNVVIYHRVNDKKYEMKLDLKLKRNQYKPYDVAICPDGRFMVARVTCIEVYTPDGNHQEDIRIKGSGKVNVTRVQVTSDGRILVGDYLGSLIVEISQTGDVIRTIHTSIKPEHMTLIHDTHIAISDRKAGKVIVIDIESGQETLRIDIPDVQGICYDEHTDCLLTTRSESADEPGMVFFNTGVIEQYSYTTGKLIACLQQGLYHPMGMTQSTEGHLFVANRNTAEIFEMQ